MPTKIRYSRFSTIEPDIVVFGPHGTYVVEAKSHGRFWEAYLRSYRRLSADAGFSSPALVGTVLSKTEVPTHNAWRLPGFTFTDREKVRSIYSAPAWFPFARLWG